MKKSWRDVRSYDDWIPLLEREQLGLPLTAEQRELLAGLPDWARDGIRKYVETMAADAKRRRRDIRRHGETAVIFYRSLGQLPAGASHRCGSLPRTRRGHAPRSRRVRRSGSSSRTSGTDPGDPDPEPRRPGVAAEQRGEVVA